MAKIGVYKITNTLTNECYIGSSRDIDSRIESHKKNSSNPRLKNDIFSIGVHLFTFEVLELCDIKDLRKKELIFIEKFNSINNGYNHQNVCNSLKTKTVIELDNDELKLLKIYADKEGLKSDRQALVNIAIRWANEKLKKCNVCKKQ